METEKSAGRVRELAWWSMAIHGHPMFVHSHSPAFILMHVYMYIYVCVCMCVCTCVCVVFSVTLCTFHSGCILVPVHCFGQSPPTLVWLPSNLLSLLFHTSPLLFSVRVVHVLHMVRPLAAWVTSVAWTSLPSLLFCLLLCVYLCHRHCSCLCLCCCRCRCRCFRHGFFPRCRRVSSNSLQSCEEPTPPLFFHISIVVVAFWPLHWRRSSCDAIVHSGTSYS